MLTSKLTEVFGIETFSGTKNGGKVTLIIIYIAFTIIITFNIIIIIIIIIKNYYYYSFTFKVSGLA